MKVKNKALVKHEMRNIWPVFIYFMGCMVIVLWTMVMKLKNMYVWYLQIGYSEDREIYFGKALSDSGEQCIIFFGIGILLLLYLQFKDNKSLQISGFIKSLPYTNQEVYRVKLGYGLSIITVPFALMSIGVIVIRSNIDTFFTYIERISIIGNEIRAMNSYSNILLYLLVVYGILIFLYLFGFWMQYLVNNNVVSLVISGLSLTAVPFIVTSCQGYLQTMIDIKTNTRCVLEALIKVVCPFRYLGGQNKYYQVYNIATGGNSGIHLFKNTFMVLKLMILVVLIVMLLMAIHECNKNHKAENQERFISINWAERLFKIGVVISCMGLVILMFEGIGGIYGVVYKVILHIVMIIAGIIAYFIVNKICAIGKR